MADDFYPFVDSGDPAPDNSHITGATEESADGGDRIAETFRGPQTPEEGRSGRAGAESAAYATRISVYDDMFSTPRVIVINPGPVRTYLEEVTNTVYRCMKEQGGSLSLMVIRELVENFIHAHFMEPIISVLDGGNTIRFADQGPGIDDKERAFEFGVTSADRDMKRYIRGTGSGLPMVQQYLEAAGGAVSIENNLGGGTVVTVSTDPARVDEIKRAGGRGAAVRPEEHQVPSMAGAPAGGGYPPTTQMAAPAYMPMQPTPGAAQEGWQQTGEPEGTWNPYASPYGGAGAGYPPYPAYPQPYQPQMGWQQMPGYQVPPAAFPQNAPGYPMPSGYPPYQTGDPRAAQMPSVPAGELMVSERGQLALSYLLEHGHGGPSELTAAYGQSGPTWSRELATLGKRGFTVKQGQKYYLTELGANWARSH